jgi:hypothetical protein
VIKIVSDLRQVGGASCNSVSFGLSVCLMVFNATFNNISFISRRSVLLVEETGVPGENKAKRLCKPKDINYIANIG